MKGMDPFIKLKRRITMTVKELIDLLKTFNQEYKIIGPVPDGFEWEEGEMIESNFTQNHEDKTVYISNNHSGF